MRLAEEPNPPMRFLAGTVAVNAAEEKLAGMRTEFEKWRKLSVSTDGDYTDSSLGAFCVRSSRWPKSHGPPDIAEELLGDRTPAAFCPLLGLGIPEKLKLVPGSRPALINPRSWMRKPCGVTRDLSSEEPSYMPARRSEPSSPGP